MVVVTKTRFSQPCWADPNAGVGQWSCPYHSSAAWPGDVALFFHMLWCTPDPAQAPTLGTEAESNLFALPQRSTSFKFKFLNDSLSESFFQKDLKARLWDITKQKAIFSLTMSSSGQWPYLKNCVLFPIFPLQPASWPLIYNVTE